MTGSEPATSGTTNRRSNQLSYNRHKPVPRRAQLGRRARPSSGEYARARLLHSGPKLQSENVAPPRARVIKLRIA